jgi:hypothetical protein
MVGPTSGKKNIVGVYNIGQPDGSVVDTWSTAPSQIFDVGAYELNGTGNVVADAQGRGAWIAQYRATDQNTSAVPSLLFVDNDGNIKFTCNINPTSRDDWNAICTEFSGLTGGLGMWFEIIFPGDTDGYFFRGEPCPMLMPDFNAGEVVQGEVQIIESANDGYQTKATA